MAHGSHKGRCILQTHNDVTSSILLLCWENTVELYRLSQHGSAFQTFGLQLSSGKCTVREVGSMIALSYNSLPSLGTIDS